MYSKHVEAWNKTYCETTILCIKLVKYWDKYTEMHGQQNVKKVLFSHTNDVRGDGSSLFDWYMLSIAVWVAQQ